MGKEKTQFSKENQPKGRGKSTRTKILDAFKRAGKTEDGFYDLLTAKAFNPEDQFSFGELLKRLSPIPKAVSPIYKFDLPEGAPPHVLSEHIVYAIAAGDIPSDVGNTCIQAIRAMIDIEEYTDLKDRIEKLEKLID